MTRPAILIAESDSTRQMEFSKALSPEYEVLLAADGAGALRILEEARPLVALVELYWGPGDSKGWPGFLEEILAHGRFTKVIVVAEESQKEEAALAVRQGAYDYFVRPIAVDRLLITSNRACQMAQLEREHSEKRPLGWGGAFDGLLGTSRPMLQIFTLIREISRTDAPLLILGESGSGKEATAQVIHRRSARRDGPFVPMNCGAIPESLLEMELFGMDRAVSGAGSVRRRGCIEAATGGTLFLERIERLSPLLQSRLQHFLEQQANDLSGHVRRQTMDTRVIGTTDGDLHRAIREQRFSEDLYRRLATVVIQLPPLRDREDDVLLLAQAFLKRLAGEHGKSACPRFTRQALCTLADQDWPGNVRQLENCIRRAVIMAEGRYVTESDLGLRQVSEPATGPRLRQAREAVERELVQRALNLHSGNISAAAEHLGISRPTLYELIERLGVRRPEAESLSQA